MKYTHSHEYYENLLWDYVTKKGRGIVLSLLNDYFGVKYEKTTQYARWMRDNKVRASEVHYAMSINQL